MNSTEILAQLFQKQFGLKPTTTTLLPASGSHRRYYRLATNKQTAIGTYGPEIAENQAFITFTKHFNANNLNVPQLYQIADDGMHYLQEDLGNIALYDLLATAPKEELIALYTKAVEKLAQLQIIGGKGLDYSVCFPRATFDQQSMLWDCNSFKYYFVKPALIPFDEQLLEDDIQKLSAYLETAPSDYFMFRDFQSRNIYLKDNEPYFIDYQGGRKGALQYDLASLLYQAKANLSNSTREKLLEKYLNELEKSITIDRTLFLEYFYGFVLIRTIQVLGTYGLRGLFERKEHFLKSIPFALQNAQFLIENHAPPVELPELKRVLLALANAPQFAPKVPANNAEKPLLVKVQSFSYKKGGIPVDDSGNGGGFVFDCRFLHNPGRYQPYKKQTGLDQPVKDFLRENSTIEEFLKEVFRMITPAVETYLARDFSSLMISFGCTGGQHRSVYSAEATAKYLREKYGVTIYLNHNERENWPT